MLRDAKAGSITGASNIGARGHDAKSYLLIPIIGCAYGTAVFRRAHRRRRKRQYHQRCRQGREAFRSELRARRSAAAQFRGLAHNMAGLLHEDGRASIRSRCRLCWIERHIAKIAFVTGPTFWLGNAVARTARTSCENL